MENWINNLTILLCFTLCIIIIILYQYLAGKSGIIDNLIFPAKSKFNSPSKLDSNHKFCLLVFNEQLKPNSPSKHSALNNTSIIWERLSLS